MCMNTGFRRPKEQKQVRCFLLLRSRCKLIYPAVQPTSHGVRNEAATLGKPASRPAVLRLGTRNVLPASNPRPRSQIFWTEVTELLIRNNQLALKLRGFFCKPSVEASARRLLASPVRMQFLIARL